MTLLRSRRSTILRVRLTELFIDPTVTHGLSILVLRVKDNNRLIGETNDPRLTDKKGKVNSATEGGNTYEQVSLKIQRRRLNLWEIVKSQVPENLIRPIIKSNIEKKAAKASNWMKQIHKDAETIWKTNAGTWLKEPKRRLEKADDSICTQTYGEKSKGIAAKPHLENRCYST